MRQPPRDAQVLAELLLFIKEWLAEIQRELRNLH
jgi:hypothetical protein